MYVVIFWDVEKMRVSKIEITITPASRQHPALGLQALAHDHGAENIAVSSLLQRIGLNLDLAV